MSQLIKSSICLIIVEIILFITPIFPQKVYSSQFSSQADVKVFVTDYESQADLKVFKVKYQSEAKGNEGLWFLSNTNHKQIKKFTLLNTKVKLT